LDLIYPGWVTAISRDAEVMTVECIINEQPRKISTKLLIGADGGDSAVRRLTHIPVMIEEYAQTAIVAHIGLARSHRGVAYERFTAEGILAMLPLSASPEAHNRCTLIWTAEQAQAAHLLQLNEQAFLSRVQQLFGYRLGRFQTLGKRSAVPLRKISTLDSTQTRVILIGNAAHSLHPVAAQGLNLGLRDVAVLLEVILEARSGHQDIGGFNVLQSYAERREGDQQQIMGFVDGLIKLFGKQNKLLSRCRGLALQLLDISPAGKYHLARLPMGIAGRLSKLASGVPL
jgi:2-octaprenyl-6-methoxyphenol hydroxylase